MEDFSDLDDIEKGAEKKNDLNLSNTYTVRIGGFGQQIGLRTYLSTLTVDELKRDISFYEKLSEDKGWPVSQIIQREVDEDRVNSIVRRYVLSEGRDIKYFPPIIIALLPREPDGSFSREFKFNVDTSPGIKELLFDKSKFRDNSSFREKFLTSSNESSVDGLYLYSPIRSFEQIFFAWDLSKFYAVVIDGQHRLQALIKAGNEDPNYLTSKQDVVFIDVSGLSNPNLTPVELLRTVFIDINTNAKSVPIVRRILMDDKDLSSLCVQSLVESLTKTGKAKNEMDFIPSPLVDWDGSSYKHELPHLTGILTLHQIISDEIVTDRLVTVDDHRNLRKIKNYIELLNYYFGVDEIIKEKATEVKTLDNSFQEFLREKEINREIFSEIYEEEAMNSILFNYDYRILEIAQESFENLFLRPIVNVFTNFLPYKLHIESLRNNNVFNVGSASYKAMLISKDKLRLTSNKNLRDRLFDLRKLSIDKLGSNYFLFFSVVGQKGIFNSCFTEIFANYKHGSNKQTIIDSQVRWLSKVNTALEKLNTKDITLFGNEDLNLTAYITEEELRECGSVALNFWEGILFEDKRIVYNSQRVRAFADVLKFVTACTLVKKVSDIVIEDYKIRYAEQRTKRLLVKRLVNKSESECQRLARLIIIRKMEILRDEIVK